MAKEVHLNVLTLNCWGIPYISKNRSIRMKAIADIMAESDYHIVCLQEIWSLDDFKMIQHRVIAKLKYSHYFHSGVVGSGICVFSQYPIQDVMFHKWSLNGYVHKIHHGDWFGGKGVGLCRIKVESYDVNLYVAHLHAEYNPLDDEYCAHRVLQAFDTAQFIRITKGGADAVILSGDLNTAPEDLAYGILRGVAGLTDACSSLLTEEGTSECAKNSYTSASVARKCPKGKRIDHILYLGSNNTKMETTIFEHPLPARVPNQSFSYSDHEAITATFKLSKGKDNVQVIEVIKPLKKGKEICEDSLKSLKRQKIWYILASCILIVPLILSLGLDYATTSIGVIIFVNILRIFLTALLCYVIFMSSIWNSIETNALIECCWAMDLYSTQLTLADDYKIKDEKNDE